MPAARYLPSFLLLQSCDEVHFSLYGDTVDTPLNKERANKNPYRVPWTTLTMYRWQVRGANEQ